jgi:hypothetical protein
MAADRLSADLVRSIRRTVRGPGDRLLLDAEARCVGGAVAAMVGLSDETSVPAGSSRSAPEILSAQLAELQPLIEAMAAGALGPEIAAEAAAELAKLKSIDADAALCARAARILAAQQTGDG